MLKLNTEVTKSTPDKGNSAVQSELGLFVQRLKCQLQERRIKFGKQIIKLTLPKSFTILSDDCWGGQLQRQLHLPYTTPTVGLYIHTAEYLNFLVNLRQPDVTELTFITTDKGFPVATTPYATIYFMHYRSQEEAASSFMKRFERIDYDNLFVKIDLGKSYVTPDDIQAWNKLNLRNSVALYSSTINQEVHNGLRIADWTYDGAMMFDITRKYFNVYGWLRHGDIKRSTGYRIINFLFFDPTAWGQASQYLRVLKQSLNSDSGSD